MDDFPFEFREKADVSCPTFDSKADPRFETSVSSYIKNYNDFDFSMPIKLLPPTNITWRLSLKRLLCILAKYLWYSVIIDTFGVQFSASYHFRAFRETGYYFLQRRRNGEALHICKF